MIKILCTYVLSIVKNCTSRDYLSKLGQYLEEEEA